MPRPRPTGPRLIWHRGSWALEWWDDGRRRRTAAGTTNQTIARQFLADHEAAAQRRPLTLSVAEALDRYVLSRVDKVTALDRLQDATNALKVGLGHLRVDQIGVARWDVYASLRVVRPRPNQTIAVPRLVSSGTLRREFNVLRAALRQAWKDGYLHKPPALEAPPDSAPRDRYLTKIEAKRLIDACVTPHVRVFVALAVSTGARKGSILALQWAGVDFENGMIDFQEPGRRLTAKRRSIVPMTAMVRAVLEEAYAVRQSEHVVEYGGRPVPTGLRWSFARLCQRAGLTWKPTPHHLKHSVASWMAMDHVPIDQAADWLATDPKTLRRVYRKFDPSYLRSVAATLEL